ncbi:hypothetical protein EON65_20720 [archaeon]|nr:MAG: hypothetical protein EON65_20720 [archaeon]
MVWCLHTIKFLYYLPMPSADIFAIAALTTTCLLPFVRQLSEYRLRDEAHEFEKIEATEASYISLTNAELLFFVALNAVATFYSGRRVARLVLRAALSKMPVLIQTIMFSVALYLFFISMVLLVFMRQLKWLRSVLFAAGAVLLILAFEGFGSLSFSSFSAASINDDHSFVFTLLSSAMTVVAWTQTVPLASITSCFVYSVIFGFASTKAMLSWVLPETAAHNLSHDALGFPFLALYIGKASSTFLVLWGSKDKLRHPLFPVLLIVAVLWPVVAYIVSYMAGYPPSLGHGIMWSTIVSTASTCASFRAQEVLALLRGSRTTHALTFKQVQISLILLMAVLCLSWTVLAVISESSAIDSDVLFPAAALLILCEDASFLPYKQHPFTLWTKIVTIWWYISVLYHIFFRGMGESVLPGLPPYSLFGWDEEISIWVLDSPLLPLLNLFMAVVPLPALYASTRQAFFSEELLFVLALVSVAPIIGGSIDCVRYLGLLGVIAAGYACYTKAVGSSKAKHSVI